MGPLQFAVVFSGMITYAPKVYEATGPVDVDFRWDVEKKGYWLPFSLYSNKEGVLVGPGITSFTNDNDEVVTLHDEHASNTIYIHAFSADYKRRLKTIVEFMRMEKIKMTHKNFRALLAKLNGPDYEESLKTSKLGTMYSLSVKRILTDKVEG